MDLISVIVPVYNSEAYLDCCIESIVNQSYKNLEIILVEDGSPDNCATICDNWASKDERIKVFHQKNGGSAQARNFGLEYAQGKYIGFVDSDDFIFPQMYETLWENINKTGADIVECDYFNVENSNFPITDKISNYSRCLNTEQALEENIRDTVCRQLVWNKLYTRHTIEGIKFVEQKYIDDEFFTYRVIARAQKITVLSTKLYCYRQQNESVMNKMYSLKRLDVIEAKQQRIEFLQNNYQSLICLAKRDYFFSCIYHGQKVLSCLRKEERKMAIALLNQAYKKYSLIDLLKAREVSVYDKCWLYLTMYSLMAVCCFRNGLRIGI